MLLEAKGLTRQIDHRVLWNALDITIAPGERIALRGPSGSGKTLLMRTLSALDLPDEGSIRFQKKLLNTWHLPTYRKKVCYLPQDATFLAGSVRESITAFFSFRSNRDLSWSEDLFTRMLDILQLPHSFADKTADHLSGGEKQLTAIIRSLLLKPVILLLDEPTSNLDEAMTERVEALIDTWMNEDSGRALLWTSHDSRQLDRITRRSIVLADSGAQVSDHIVNTAP